MTVGEMFFPQGDNPVTPEIIIPVPGPVKNERPAPVINQVASHIANVLSGRVDGVERISPVGDKTAFDMHGAPLLRWVNPESPSGSSVGNVGQYFAEKFGSFIERADIDSFVAGYLARQALDSQIAFNQE